MRPLHKAKAREGRARTVNLSNPEPQGWAGSRFRYTGQIALPELQLYHYKARVYDPIAGRFLQTDPIGYKDGPDWYLYVGDDPTDKTDPTGECGVFLAYCIGFGVGAAIEIGFQAADPKVRADYARAGEALTRGDIGSAANAAGTHVWGVLAAGGAGALGVRSQ